MGISYMVSAPMKVKRSGSAPCGRLAGKRPASARGEKKAAAGASLSALTMTSMVSTLMLAPSLTVSWKWIVELVSPSGAVKVGCAAVLSLRMTAGPTIAGPGSMGSADWAGQLKGETVIPARP